MADRTILLIEDDSNIVELLSIHLHDLNCEVISTGDGLKGLSLAKESKYALIILDVMLPGLNGMEVCRKIRQADRHTPILMLTARSEEIDKVMGLKQVLTTT